MKSLKKTPSGIEGLDEITDGGLPQGRPILVCGGPGCGKTLMALQFLIKGIVDYNEPGVLLSFEEKPKDLSENVYSLGYDLEELQSQNKLRIDYIKIESSEIEETGEYDLEGLFVRLNYAIDTIGAKRVVLDTIESLFSGLENFAVLRSEIRRLFQWLKEKEVTTIITGEKGTTTLTRQGLEEYVSDCVILLDFRVNNQIATRRLRIIKYRGSTHGTNEYPFLIDESGISVLPITSLKLDYPSSSEIISSGIPALDSCFSRNGLYKGSSILITGKSGTAKTILAAHFAISSCLRDDRVLYFSFEESPGQLIKNMKTLGLNFTEMIDRKLLDIYSTRPSLQGLELHLLTIIRIVNDFQPKTVIIDPISSLITIGTKIEVRAMLLRLIDFLKTKEITAIYINLTEKLSSKTRIISSELSSVADTWIHLKNDISNHKNKRFINIVKTRGMGHINNEHLFAITEKGIELQSLLTKKATKNGLS